MPPATEAALVTTQWSSVTISAPQGFDSYWASRPREVRDNMARRQRKAERDGVDFEEREHSDPATVADAIGRYCTLEAQGWKGKGGTALSLDADDGRFYLELLTRAAAEGRGSVHELWGGGRLLASRFVLRSGQTHAILKTTVRRVRQRLLRRVVAALPPAAADLRRSARDRRTLHAREPDAGAVGDEPSAHAQRHRVPVRCDAKGVRGAPAVPVRRRGRGMSESAATAPRLTTRLIAPRDVDAALLTAWQALSRAAVEPNPFFEPWALQPAIEHFDSGEVRLLLVERPGSDGAMQLVGFAPVFERRAMLGLLRIRQVWTQTESACSISRS